MKFIVFLGDGMADLPIPALGNKTPLEAADKPHFDSYAKKGICGMVKTVPDLYSPGSDVANLSVMGYDPKKYYTGRSPLEAASIGVTLSENETAFRANVVTLSGEGEFEDLTMEDYSAGEIATEQSKKLIEDFAKEINNDTTALYSGVSYRHLLVLKDKVLQGKLTPPHDISKRKVKDYLPEDSEILSLMKKSYEFFKNHPYNIAQRKAGKKEVSSIWVWGEGKKPMVGSFYEKYQKKGAVISAVDLIKGIGILADMESIDVPNVTGNIDTNFEGKAEAAIDAFRRGVDFVYLHMEAPDECGHRFEAENKVKAIEYIDNRAFRPVLEYLETCGDDFAILVLPDHPTPVETGTHSREPVPYFAYCNRYPKEGNAYTEAIVRENGNYLEDGHTLLGKFLSLELFQ